MAGAAGVDLVQIRENDLDDQTLVDLAGRAVQVTRDTRTRIIVNDRADVALAAGAAGCTSGARRFRSRGSDPWCRRSG